MDAASTRRAVQARFAEADPELPNGFAEHTPMGADALLALGLDPAAVLAWTARHEPTPVGPGAPITVRRLAILADLERLPWDEVLRRNLEGLASHVGAHLFHGLIRTAHAVRCLRAGGDDPAALGELATALAAWHIWAGTADGPAGDSSGPTTAAPRETILDAARRGAGACAAKPSIVTIHAVTAPMAFLLVADLVDTATFGAAAVAFGHTHARYPAPPASDRTARPGADHLATLLDHWDAHPAKLSEAALRGFDTTGDGVFLDAMAAITGPWTTTAS
ncbi:MAG: hypothetical protein R2761_09585 [Acidimicrobiales bacterium]